MFKLCLNVIPPCKERCFFHELRTNKKNLNAKRGFKVQTFSTFFLDRLAYSNSETAIIEYYRKSNCP